MSTWRYHRAFLPAWLPYFCIVCITFLFPAWFLFYKDVKVPRSHFNVTFKPMTIFQARDPSFDFQKAMQDLDFMKTPQNDPTLVQLIRNYYIDPPSTEPYNLENPDKLEYYYGFTPYLDEKLDQKDNGFYVQCRAFDGEEHSPTLFFEKVRHWNGLLIEPDPIKYQALRRKHRKAFTLNACVHYKPYPEKITLTRSTTKEEIETFEVQCFPLYSILLALDRVIVNVLSLSSNCGSDNTNVYDVLEPLPLSDLIVNVINIRMYHHHKTEMETVMDTKQYQLDKRIRTRKPYVFDYLFIYKVSVKHVPVFWTTSGIVIVLVMCVILYLFANVFIYHCCLKKSKTVQKQIIASYANAK